MKITFDKQDKDAWKEMPQIIEVIVYMALALGNMALFGAIFFMIGLNETVITDFTGIALIVLILNIFVFIERAILALPKNKEERKKKK